MALKAGRVGVRKDQVDADGRLKGGSGGLTPEQTAKLEKALITPMTPPISNELVGVGTANEQIRIQLGDGVELTGDTSPYVLKATGGSSGFGLHPINLSANKNTVVDLSDIWDSITGLFVYVVNLNNTCSGTAITFLASDSEKSGNTLTFDCTMSNASSYPRIQRFVVDYSAKTVKYLEGETLSPTSIRYYYF